MAQNPSIAEFDYDPMHYLCMDVRDGKLSIEDAREQFSTWHEFYSEDQGSLDCIMIDVQAEYGLAIVS